MFKINIITAFPEVFPGSLDVSILAKARQKKIWDLNTVDLKKFTSQTKSIDDKPFGGGPGMVIRADVLQNAYEKAKIFFKRNGLLLNWIEFEKLDQPQKINTLAMIAPITNEEKQKLLEATAIEDRISVLESIISFYLHETGFNNQTIQ